MGAYLSLRRGAMRWGWKSHIVWLAAWPPALCIRPIRRTEFGFHREPFTLKVFDSPTDKSRVAAEVLVKAAAVPQLNRSVAS